MRIPTTIVYHPDGRELRVNAHDIPRWARDGWSTSRTSNVQQRAAAEDAAHMQRKATEISIAENEAARIREAERQRLIDATSKPGGTRDATRAQVFTGRKGGKKGN